MPKKIEWTAAQDLKIKRMRAERASWDNIAVAVGVSAMGTLSLVLVAQ